MEVFATDCTPEPCLTEANLEVAVSKNTIGLNGSAGLRYGGNVTVHCDPGDNELVFNSSGAELGPNCPTTCFCGGAGTSVNMKH